MTVYDYLNMNDKITGGMKTGDCDRCPYQEKCLQMPAHSCGAVMLSCIEMPTPAPEVQIKKHDKPMSYSYLAVPNVDGRDSVYGILMIPISAPDYDTLVDKIMHEEFIDDYVNDAYTACEILGLVKDYGVDAMYKRIAENVLASYYDFYKIIE